MEHVEAKFAVALFDAATRRMGKAQRFNSRKRAAAALTAFQTLDLGCLTENEQKLLGATLKQWFTPQQQVHHSVSHT